MALKLEFFSIIIPIEKLRKILDREEVEEMLGNPMMGCWHDEHLYRDGAMTPHDIADLVDEWAKRGLEPYPAEGKTRMWNDVCVADYHSGPTLPCSWLEFDVAEHVVWLKGESRGRSIGPNERDIYEGFRLSPPSVAPRK